MTLKTTQLRDAITFALAVGATAAVGTGVAFAQEGEQEATTLDRIEVTGSRIKRTDIETSQPIFSLSREDISAQGLTSVGDVIQNISANGSTLNTTMNNGGNGETRVNLRNLGSNRTLVLVNGRRWVGGTGLGGAVDLNTIPTAAVERIEVLKDGASSIYGSDAIAGVVNIILRQNFDGAEANAYIGQFDKGDGTRQSYDFTVGSVGDRWSAMLGVGYVKEEPVWAGDREISAVPVFGSTPGFGGSSTTPDGRFCILDTTTFACANPDGAYGLWRANPNDPRGWTEWGGTPDNFNFAPLNYLLTPQERVSVFANGSLDISDNLRFKTTVTYNNRKSEQLLAAMPVVVGFPGASQASDIVISQDSIYNPYGQDINWIQRRAVETGGRSFKQNVDTFAFNGAFEGTFDIADKPFDWEAGMFYGENRSNNSTNGLLTYTAIRNALGPSMLDGSGNPICVTTPGDASTAIPGCVPADFLGGAGSLTPEMLNYLTFEAHDQFEYKQKSYYASIGGDLFDLPGGPLAFSFGLEHREESGFDRPDALINAGDTTGNARTATEGSYKLDEAYLELAIPVLSDVPGARLLDFSVATRYSDYSNFGDTLNSKFGFRWKPIDDLLVRGNYAEGFRAPSISELFSGVGDSFPTISDPCSTTNFGGLDAAAQARCVADGVPTGGYNQVNTQIRISVGGNPNLLPEKAENYTFGFVYNPSWLEGFDISLDWWKIELTDTITAFSGQQILNDCYREGNQQACGLITRGGGGIITDLLSAGLNIGSTEVEGYDMTVGYRLPETSWGRFSFVWDTTYMANYENDGDGDNLVGEYFDRNNFWRIRSNLLTRWEMGDWGATWSLRYYDSQVEDCSGFNAANTQLLCSDPDRRTADGPAPRNKLDDTFYNDLTVYWNAPWNAKIAVGVNNIFDEDPPFSASTFANSFDPQYEVPGRFLYMRYTQKF
ncbi:TonB-dependent receptor [Marilutibacter chinensis]|uniref:TonB-dependent receptor n=1 Tax=Marilutibacter chinensis TaxID=2912247 RepID=A0ABS9HUG0_9GAMM|nr:TonB-dependent receptor [Lysobacter chinensis]MCF7222534.1 TonB-dependent receptor [Lysobacter chinensis]